MTRPITNYDLSTVADHREGDVYLHLEGCRAWTMVDAYRAVALGEPCSVCGRARGGPPIRRSARRRGLVHCLQCDAASTDGVVEYHGEPVGTRWNPGWEPETTEPPLRARRQAKFRPRGAKATV